MIEWIVSSSVLIAVVILLRTLLKGKTSLRLQYALWGLVLLRLLIPVSFGSTALSVTNAVPRSARTLPETVVTGGSAHISTTSGERIDYQFPRDYTKYLTDSKNLSVREGTGELSGAGIHVRQFDLKGTLRSLWIAGMAAVALCFLVSNLRFARALRRSRRKLTEAGGLSVYLTEEADTPCLFGLLRPAIYVTPEAAEEGRLRHVLEHERTHFRHGDQVWSLLRGLCLALHWYNPLVWWAAFLSRRDCELACDEATIRRLGEGERAAYGRTLLVMTCAKRPALLVTATTMTGSRGGIRERITLIVKKPKTALITLAVVLVAAAVAVGCTFTGAKPTEPEPTPAWEVTPDEWFVTQARPEAEAFCRRSGLLLSEERPSVRTTEVRRVDVIFRTLGQRFYLLVSFAKEGDDWALIEDPVTKYLTDAPYALLELDLGDKTVPEPVAAYALDYAQRELDFYEKEQGYVFDDARVTGITKIETGTAGLNESIDLYLVEYRFHPAEGQALPAESEAVVDGYITERMSAGQPCLLLHTDGENWERVGAVTTGQIETEYGTPEMLEKYGSAYTAAAMELYARYRAEQAAAAETYRIDLLFYDAAGDLLSPGDGWYDLSAVDTLAVTWTGGAPQGVRLMITPTGTATYELASLLLAHSLTEEELEQGEARFSVSELDTEGVMGHLWAELDEGPRLLASRTYNVYDPSAASTSDREPFSPVGFLAAVPSADAGEIGQAWAEVFAEAYTALPSGDPRRCKAAAVLDCTLTAQSLLQPKELICLLHLAADPADAAAFEQSFAGWARTLTREEAPAYEGWWTFGWFVVLRDTGDGNWLCVDAGSGGYGGWGWLNYDRNAEEEAEWAMNDPDADGEYLLMQLPGLDLSFWNAHFPELLDRLQEVCLTDGRVYGPEVDRMWADVYPDDQAYRDMYMILGFFHTDAAYAEGVEELLKAQYAFDPASFERCLREGLSEEQETQIRIALAWDSLVLENWDVTLRAGESLSLLKSQHPAGEGLLRWASSDPTVASVDETGAVTALKPGVTTVTVRLGGVEYRCTVRVVSAQEGDGAALRVCYYEEPTPEHYGPTVARMVDLSEGDPAGAETIAAVRAIIDGIDQWEDDNLLNRATFDFIGDLWLSDREFVYYFTAPDRRRGTGVIYYDHYFATLSHEDAAYLSGLS